jgi:periplasmic protein TonB
MAPPDRRGLRSHLSGSVPVSIVVHLVLLLVLVVIPLASDIMLPLPLGPIDSWVLAAPAPPPPDVVLRSARSSANSVSPAPIIPTKAPDTIAPDPPAPQAFVPVGAVEGGLPSGFGVEGGLPPLIEAPVPPSPPLPQGPVRAAQLPELPRKVVDVHPLYPEIARSARVEGTVILEAVLDTSGRITQLRVLRSVPLLDQAAIDAVRQWRYTPSTYNGRAVSVLMTITVHFSLQQ